MYLLGFIGAGMTLIVVVRRDQQYGVIYSSTPE